MLKFLSLICLFLALLFSPIILRFLPNIEPIEYKYLLLRDWSKYLIELIIGISFLLFLVNAWLQRQALVSSAPFDIWLAGFFLICIGSFFYTVDSGLTIRAIVDLGFFIILYFLVKNILAETKYLRYTIYFLLGIAVALSLYGIYQYFFEYSTLKVFLDDYIAKDTLDARWDLVRGAIYQKRISSTFGLHNMFASFLGMAIPVSIALSCYEQERRSKIMFFIIALILLVAMLFTFSIGGWLSLFFALGIELILLWRALGYYRILEPKTKRRLLFFLISCAAILFIVISAIVGIKRFTPITLGSIKCRWIYLVSTLKIIKDNFLLGTGLGTFGNVYLKYMIPGKINPAQDYATLYAHNLCLQILSEIGIIGLVVFFIFILKLLWYGFKKTIYFKDRYTRLISIGIFSGLCFFLMHNTVDIGFYFFSVAFYWWFLLGVLAILVRTDSGVTYEKTILARHKKAVRLDVLVWGIFSLLLIFQITKNFLADIHFYKGSVYLNKRLYDESLWEFKKAARLDSYNSRFFEMIGDVYQTEAYLSKSKQGFLVAAKTNYLKALNLSKYNPRVYYKFGLISNLQGRWKEAIYYFEKATHYYPSEERYHRALGILYLNNNRINEAFLKYKDLERLNPRNPENLFFGAMVNERLGRKELAIKMYKDVLSINSKHSGAIKKLNDLVQK